MTSFSPLIKVCLWIVCVAILSSCSDKPQNRDLEVNWEARHQFNRSMLKEYYPSQWKKVTIPYIFYRDGEVGTYRGNLALRKVLPERALEIAEETGSVAILIDRISSQRIEFFINEQMIGSLGSLDPYNPAMGRQFQKVIPRGYLRTTGDNVLTIVMQVEKEDRVNHALYGTLRLGSAEAIYRYDLINNIICFCLITIYLLVGVVFLLIGIRRSGELYNVYFGLFSISFALFELANIHCNELIFGDYILLRMRVDHVSLHLTVAAFTLFINHLFVKRHTLPVLLITAYCIVLAGFDLFKGLDYNLDDRYNFWHLAVVAGFVYIFIVLIRQSLTRNIDAIFLLCGATVLAVSTAHDMMVDAGLFLGPATMHYGAIVVFLSVLLYLVNRFGQLHEEKEELNRDLERKVKLRTEELQLANEKIFHLKRKEQFLDAFNLTAREKEILKGMMAGLSPNDMAGKMNISIRTVNTHVYNMYQKMGVHSHLEVFARFNSFQ